MNTLVRNRASLAWLVLVALTLVQWMVGTQTGVGGFHHVGASLAILAVAVFKVRLVGLYFMDLRHAPTALRTGFEGYCLGIFGLLSLMYLFG